MFVLYLDLIDEPDDKIKFEQVYKEYKKRMLFIAVKILHDQYEAEDAVHNAFIGIAKNIHMIHDVHSKDTFSYVIKAANNAALNLLSKKKTIVENSDNIFIKDLNDEEFFEVVEIRESYNEVLEIIKNMDPLYRDVLFLHYVKDMTAKEIGKLLNRKSGTVTQQIVRGKNYIIINMQKEGKMDE